jgi:hypothetical protein
VAGTGTEDIVEVGVRVEAAFTSFAGDKKRTAINNRHRILEAFAFMSSWCEDNG